MIEEVFLDKTSVCSGEDFSVTLKLKHKDAANLAVRIGENTGNPAIMNFKTPGIREFYASVRDDSMNVDFKKVSIEVKDCGQKEFSTLYAKLSPYKPSTADFEIKIPENSVPLKYEWTFGDGTVNITDKPFSSHDYGMREQKSFQSTFIVSVKIIYKSASPETVRASVTFPNIHYISSLMGDALIPVFYEKFPVIDKNSISSEITVNNIFDEKAEFTDVEIALKSCGRDVSDSIISLSADKILSHRNFFPGTPEKTSLTINKSDISADTCNITIKLTGNLSNGKKISSIIYLDIPSKRKAEGDRTVDDSDLIQKLEKARKYFGDTRPITSEDIKKLELEGKI
jgi:hypothetical protein